MASDTKPRQLVQSEEKEGVIRQGDHQLAIQQDSRINLFLIIHKLLDNSAAAMSARQLRAFHAMNIASASRRRHSYSERHPAQIAVPLLGTVGRRLG